MSRIGWRWWDLAKDGSLRSVNDVLWPPNEPLEAECMFDGKAHSDPDGKCPDWNCGCGFWAYDDPEIASGLPHIQTYLRQTKVFGAIEGWGKLIEHELGWRSQFAIPRGMWVIRGRLHAAYEVQRFTTLDALTAVWDFHDEAAG